jgi:hypothetical protein
MIWTAWNNGQHHGSGAGYGFRVEAKDRDASFDRRWKAATIRLPEHPQPVSASVNIDKDSFWTGDCRELISQVIGRWLISHGHAPWAAGKPPRFEVRHVSGTTFEVNGLAA